MRVDVPVLKEIVFQVSQVRWLFLFKMIPQKWIVQVFYLFYWFRNVFEHFLSYFIDPVLYWIRIVHITVGLW